MDQGRRRMCIEWGYKENAVRKKAEFLKYVNGIKGSNAKEL